MNNVMEHRIIRKELHLANIVPYLHDLWFNGVASINPRFKTAKDGSYILKTVFEQNGRRTGA